jgi:hypothetical protein
MYPVFPTIRNARWRPAATGFVVIPIKAARPDERFVWHAAHIAIAGLCFFSLVGFHSPSGYFRSSNFRFGTKESDPACRVVLFAFFRGLTMIARFFIFFR